MKLIVPVLLERPISCCVSHDNPHLAMSKLGLIPGLAMDPIPGPMTIAIQDLALS